MTHSRQSLLDYLRAKDPSVFVSECKEENKSKSNSRSGKTQWAKPQIIIEWKDFEYDALESIYRGALRQVLQRPFDLAAFPIPEKPFRRIHKESSVTALVIKWNQSVVSAGLAAACSENGIQVPRGEVFMESGDQAKWPGNDARFQPDWAGTQPASIIFDAKMPQPENILPGDSKPSRNWLSKQIPPDIKNKLSNPPQWYLPLQQVYSYCIAANARYGYLITERELVVLRLRPVNEDENPDPRNNPHGLESIKDNGQALKKARSSNPKSSTPASRTKKRGMLEWKAIPWQDDNATDRNTVPQSLTINLALWWLHIMAADKHEIEDTYPPLQSAVWSNAARPDAMSPGNRKRARADEWSNDDDSESGDDILCSPTKRHQTRSVARATRSVA